MSRSPYSSYHGRKHNFRSVLIGILAALVVLLAAVLAGYYFGLFNIPGQPVGGPTAATATPSPAAEPSQEPAVIIEPPSAAPSPSPSASAAQADLSGYTPRDLPASLGLVLAQADALPDQSRHGVLVDMTDADLTALGDDFSAKLAALPYAAAWVGADADAELTAQAAALGFDELVLAASLPATEEEATALTQRYRDIKAQLGQAGWKGRLGLDVDQGIFAAPGSQNLTAAVAQSFDRLYFRKTLTSGNKTALADAGFAANGRTLVTVVKSAASLNYAWAVLPS